MQQDSRREILAFCLLALAAFLWICLLTHAPEDYLAPGLASPTHNACGPVGAFISFHFIAWVGKLSALGLSTCIALVGAAALFRRSIDDWGWKLCGVALMALALSALEVAIYNDDPRLSTLPGGYYGQFIHQFLLGQLSAVGGYLLLAFVMLVAFVISTDTLLYPVFQRAGAAALDRGRWESAGEKMKSTASRLRVPRVRWPEFPRKSVIVGENAATTRGTKRTSTKKKNDEKKKEAKTGKSVAKSGARSKSKSPAKDENEPAVETIEDEDRIEDDEYEYEYVYEDEEGDGDEDDEYEYVYEDEEDDGDEDDEYEYVYEDEEDEEEAEDEDEEGEEEAEDSANDEEKKGNRPPLVIRAAAPQPRPAKPPPRPRQAGPYRLPPLDLLNDVKSSGDDLDRPHLEQIAAKIEETLRHFKIEARVVEVQKGPTITQYEITLAAGIKVNKIVNLSDDLAMALKAPSVRIVAPIPGKSTVGIEVPNKRRSTVGLRELLESPEIREEEFKLPLALGKDVAGNAEIGDLGEMPHLLIAGSTGSGKSVAINSVIISLLMTRSPDEVKLILVDPKMVELAQFENIPHLLAPVVTDMKKAPSVLGWLVDKMEERYELLAGAGVRHLSGYNSLGREKLHERMKEKLSPDELEQVPERLPFIVVIIDELADLMMTASKEVESSITRLSQKSRAVGIHVILATQRPSVDVITGLIKANMPSRISFHVASRVDSRTILDRNGSEKLLGKGDMLFLPPGTSALKRVQGTFISDKEIRDVVEFAVQQAEPQFSAELTRFGVEGAGDACEEDELFEDAVRIVLESRRGSVTLLQRQLQIGYTRASRLMELMHERGLVGPFKGSKAREVYYTLDEWEQAKARHGRTQEGEDDASEDAGDTDDDGSVAEDDREYDEEPNE